MSKKQQGFVSGEVHKQALERAAIERQGLQLGVHELQAHLSILRPDLVESDPTLRSVAEVLLHARDFGEPAPGGPGHQTDVIQRPRPSSKPPVGGDPQIRAHAKGFARAVERAVRTYHQKVTGEYQRQDPTQGPKGRCKTRTCENDTLQDLKKRIKGQTIDTPYCASCAGKLTPTEGDKAA